jgi:hypothetical protein
VVSTPCGKTFTPGGAIESGTKQAAFQCYGVGTQCIFTTGADVAPGAWIQLIPQAYTIPSANFYTSKFKLIKDRYISLASQFSQ